MSAVVNGGDQNYSFEWSNGATTASLNNLLAGQYNLTVTDGNGGTGVAEILGSVARA